MVVILVIFARSDEWRLREYSLSSGDPVYSCALSGSESKSLIGDFAVVVCADRADLTCMSDPNTRLAKALLRLAEIQAAGDEAPVSITQKALGWIIGLSRESTNKLLRQWEAAGYVTLGKGSCVIRQRHVLQRIAMSTPGDPGRAPSHGFVS